MRTFEQLAAQIEAYLDSVSPEQLARKLMRHGVKFRNPPKPEAETSGQYPEVRWVFTNEKVTGFQCTFEARSVQMLLSAYSPCVTEANANELAIAA